MLSFFELLIFTTTGFSSNIERLRLWFAFILWTTDIYNNRLCILLYRGKVVICFHSLNYWYLQQQIIWYAKQPDVVICFHSLNYWYLQQLHPEVHRVSCVVICFHSLNYWYLQQRNVHKTQQHDVVICFHSLYYWYLQQLTTINLISR